MKKILLATAAILYCTCISFGQTVKPDTSASVLPKLNIAVPDIPAFNAMGIDPSNVLRPSDIKALATEASGFLDKDNKLIIPKSFALEIAPFFLSPQYFNTKKYISNSRYRFLHRIRFSAATSVGDNDINARKLGFGLRLTILNNGDYLADSDFVYGVQKHTINRNDAKKKTKDSFQKKFNIRSIDAEIYFQHLKTYKKYSKDEDSIVKYKALQKIYNQYCGQLHVTDWTNADMDNYKADFKKNHWNDRKMEFAFSPVFQAVDSMGKGAFTSGYNVWLVYANGYGSWGQLIIGLTYSGIRNADSVKFRNITTLSNRFYVGSNKVKGFVELSYSIKGKQLSDNGAIIVKSENSALADLGLEFNIMPGVWAHLSAGVNNFYDSNVLQKPQLIANTHFYFTLPEKFSLF